MTVRQMSYMNCMTVFKDDAVIFTPHKITHGFAMFISCMSDT